MNDEKPMLKEIKETEKNIIDIIVKINNVVDKYPLYVPYLKLEHHLPYKEMVELIRTERLPYLVNTIKKTELVLLSYLSKIFSFMHNSRIRQLEREIEDLKALKGMYSRLVNTINHVEVLNGTARDN